MRIILDTNVLVSGIFFGGPPFQILNAWRDHRLQLVMSTDILTEHQRVAAILGQKYPQVDLHPILDLLNTDGYQGIHVLKPRPFVDTYLMA